MALRTSTPLFSMCCVGVVGLLASPLVTVDVAAEVLGVPVGPTFTIFCAILVIICLGAAQRETPRSK